MVRVLRAHEIRTAVVSSSKNCAAVLEAAYKKSVEEPRSSYPPKPCRDFGESYESTVPAAAYGRQLRVDC